MFVREGENKIQLKKCNIKNLLEFIYLSDDSM